MSQSVIVSKQPTLPLIRSVSWLNVCLVSLFVLAALARMDQRKAPGLLVDREYTSAILARYYFLTSNNVQGWQRDIAVATRDRQPVLEPPLVEYLVSLIYRLAGREEIYYSRYLTSAFWLIGGVFMNLIARKLVSTTGAIFATAYYLFVPMGVLISRSFQPDSLMMMMFLASLYWIVTYFEEPATKRMLLAAAATGLTLLLRPLVLFALVGAFFALALCGVQDRKRQVGSPLVVFWAIGLFPALLYYGNAILVAGFLRWKVTSSFMPYLFTTRTFWLGWWTEGTNAVEPVALIAAIIGFFFLRDRFTRYLVVGLALGYLLFGLAFTYHIHTHGYYHIQLFPVVGLCVAALMTHISSSLKERAPGTWVVPLAVALLLAVYFSHLIELDRLGQPHFEEPVVAQEIGEIVHHSPWTVFVAPYYGVPLEYYGELTGAPWPKSIADPPYRAPGARAMTVQERLDALGFSPEYFVITDFDLYQSKHQDLQTYLESNCSIYAQAKSYLIYSGCRAAAGK